MASTHQPLSMPHLDAALQVGGLLLRAAGYAGLALLASHFDFGWALCLGLLVGDFAASVGNLVWQFRDGMVRAFAQLAVLTLVFWCLKSRLAWPADPAMQAIVGLAAFGVFASRTGGSLLTQLGPREREFG